MDSLKPWLPITFSGRLNRLPFFLIWALMMALSFVLGFLTEKFPNALVIFATLAVALYISIYQVSAFIRRLHDIDKTAWLTLLVFVPIINFIFVLYLFFAKGTQGPNQYGADPLEYNNYTDYLNAQKKWR